MSENKEPFSIRLENGIMIGTYHVEHIDMKVAKFAYEAGIKAANGKRYLSIADIRLLKKIDPDAREFLSNSDAYATVLAGAMLVKSVYQKIGGNIYLYFQKQPIPTKLFTEKEAAIEWLNQFKTDDPKLP